MACHGADGRGSSKAGKTGGKTVMNTLHVLYGGGAMVAALLLVYLVYALFRAEEF
jgi:K+-transporting ATPase KdpF subunit